MRSGNVLVLHADRTMADRLQRSLIPAGYKVALLKAAEMLESGLRDNRCDLLFLEDCPPSIDALTLLGDIRLTYPHLPVVVMSRNHALPRVVAAIQAGAVDYLSLNAEEELLLACVQKALASLGRSTIKVQSPDAGSIIFASPTMSHLLATAQRIAGSAATVMIQGESGTGKELLARFIHSGSRRAGPFIAMNCAALPDNLAESELFGYERGAFTGADQRKPGKFELAHGGTLLLDEIGEMPLALQAKLLRALQEKQIDRVGGRKTVSVDSRVIATTNRDLAQMVREGTFRQDLYYRLRVIPLQVPALRQRLEDIPLLIEHFIDKYHSTPDHGRPFFTREALQRLKQWQWPGNVRELENVVARSILVSGAAEIGPDNLLLDTDLTGPDSQPAGQWVGMTVRDLEKKLIFDTLSHVDQNRTQAARMLGISIRTLRNKLREYRDAYDILPRAAGDH